MRRKYFFFLIIALIVCITVLSDNYTNKINDINNIKDKPSRFIIKAPEWGHFSNGGNRIVDGKFRITISAKKSKSLVEPIPLPDPNEPIIINLLD